MNNSLFQTVVLGAFVVFGLGAMILFATFSSQGSTKVGEVLIWGTLSAKEVQPALDVIQTETDVFNGVSYQSMSDEDFIPKLVAAIAAGRGPDLVIFPTSYILSQGDKLQKIPYSFLSRRDFQDTYLEAGEVLLMDDGLWGVPFVIDPLVLYWNRSIFAEAGLAQAPKYWDEVTANAGVLSQSDDSGTLTRSAIALGTWDNIRHAKGVLLSLIRQLGNEVVVRGENKYVSVLKDGANGEQAGALSAVRFYTDFSDPVKSMYSWNRSQSDSASAFVSGQLALYLGRASELLAIRASNPNLNFDVAAVPAIRGGGKSVEADMFSLSIPRGSRNTDGALQVIEALSTANVDTALREVLVTPSVRRDQQASSEDNAYAPIFRQAALSSFVFLDPNPASSDSVFKRMVEQVTSGDSSIGQSVSEASTELSALLGVQ